MKPYHIMLVDDDISYLEFLQEALSHLEPECNIVTSTSGNHAVSVLETLKFDLIICDLKMPDGDGYAVLDYVQNKMDTPYFVLMTGYVDLIESEVMAKGAKMVLFKPVKIDVLTELIANKLHLHKKD
jgi:two-component system, NtrC family, response regulator HydG